MHLVFSYGTLKRGQPNHHHMAAGIESGDCELVGFGVTLTRYPLIVDQLFNIPFLLDVTDNLNAMNVEGEVYSVNDVMLERLDRIERHPVFYTRREIPVCINGNTEQLAWCYLMHNFRKDFLQLPAVQKYDSKDYPAFLAGSQRPPTEEEMQKFISYVKGTD